VSFLYHILIIVEINIHTYTMTLGTAVAQWLRCCATNQKVAGSIPDCATNQKVAGSIPDGVIGIFH
jgi:hypothetical protein